MFAFVEVAVHSLEAVIDSADIIDGIEDSLSAVFDEGVEIILQCSLVSFILDKMRTQMLWKAGVRFGITSQILGWILVRYFKVEVLGDEREVQEGIDLF